jgi:hypothetical protein
VSCDILTLALDDGVSKTTSMDDPEGSDIELYVRPLQSDVCKLSLEEVPLDRLFMILHEWRLAGKPEKW